MLDLKCESCRHCEFIWFSHDILEVKCDLAQQCIIFPETRNDREEKEVENGSNRIN